MPTYSYTCDACGASFELEQRITADPIKKCTSCGQDKARRMITSGNFILKGGGWYADGYGSSSSGGSGGKGSASSSSGGDSTSSSASSSSSSSSSSPSSSSD